MPTAKKSDAAESEIATPGVTAAELPTREGEEPWTSEELDEVIEDLKAEIVKHHRAIEQAEAELQNLLGTAPREQGATRPTLARPTSSATRRCPWQRMHVTCSSRASSPFG